MFLFDNDTPYNYVALNFLSCAFFPALSSLRSFAFIFSCLFLSFLVNAVLISSQLVAKDAQYPLC